MTHLGLVFRSGAIVVGIGLLAACQGPDGPVDTMSRRDRMGGPMATGTAAPVATDSMGNATRRENMGGALTPGSSGAVGTGIPSSNRARELNQTPRVFDDNRGAPL